MSETRYTKEHEWVLLDGNIATVGITDHAQQALGDIVFVELPEAGREVTEGEAVAVVESVKAASDVYAPLAGTVTEGNQAIVDDPALVNTRRRDRWLVLQTRSGRCLGLRVADGSERVHGLSGDAVMDALAELTALEVQDGFVARHIGPSEADIAGMLHVVGAATLADLAAKTVPSPIRSKRALNLPPALDEAGALTELRELAARNASVKSLIGQGYHGTHTPPVILRNVLENPGWYTAYTPYQAEIAQGRLEALLNFQTMICDLTAMPIANASLLDEATAAAEAVTMAHAVSRAKSDVIAVASDLHPQTRAVLETRARPLGWALIEFAPADIAAIAAASPFAVVLQYPGTTGAIRALHEEINAAHEVGALAIVAADLLSLALLTPPGEMGADVVVGSAQRFGVPMGYGGPHAAFFATRDAFRRQMPGRLVGVSVDASGAPAMRLALQTREQHIRREKATSNICTAQVLLAVVASMYAVWHGPEGLRRIARRVNLQARLLAGAATRGGHGLRSAMFFDTIAIETGDAGPAGRGGPRGGLQPAPDRRHRRRDRARRDGDAHRSREPRRRPERRPPRRAAEPAACAAARHRFPGARRVQPASFRARDAALPQTA